MPLDPKTAAQVAREHGLTLGDAAALARMADTRDEAAELAAQFAPEPDVDSMVDEVVARTGGSPIH